MFKVGDKVKVSNFRSGTNYKSATIVHIDSNDVPLPYLVIVKSSRSIWCSGNDLKLIPPTPKEMLKVGMVVENNIGTLFMVYKNKNDNMLFIEENGNYSQLENYNDNLTSDYSGRYDIVKIYRLRDSNSCLGEISVNCRDLIWERKPEYYNGKVVCIENHCSVCFTKGKIYQVKNGLINDDSISADHYFSSPIKDIYDLNSHSLFAKFIELVED